MTATLDAAGLESFLRAVGEDASDRTPRLVFADWLQDRDDGRADAVRDAVAEEALELFHPPAVRRIGDYKTYRADGTGRRAILFRERVTLYPVPRPVWRVTGPLSLVGSLRAAVECDGRFGPVSLSIRWPMPVPRTGLRVLLGCDVAPNGTFELTGVDWLCEDGFEVWAGAARGPVLLQVLLDGM